MIELTPDVILMAKARRFAIEKHKGQKYGPHDYTYHLERVVANVQMRMKDDPMLPIYIAVAWLHDVMEDCGVSYTELAREFGVEIAYAVERLSKMKGLSYGTYIQNCIDYAIAREVKICDTMSNLTESFETGNTKGLAKYPKQLHMLIEGVVE